MVKSLIWFQFHPYLLICRLGFMMLQLQNQNKVCRPIILLDPPVFFFLNCQYSYQDYTLIYCTPLLRGGRKQMRLRQRISLFQHQLQESEGASVKKKRKTIIDDVTVLSNEYVMMVYIICITFICYCWHHSPCPGSLFWTFFMNNFGCLLNICVQIP